MTRDTIFLKGMGAVFCVVAALVITLGVKSISSPKHFDYALLLIPFGIFLLLFALGALFEPQTKLGSAILFSVMSATFGSAFLLMALFGKGSGLATSGYPSVGDIGFILFFVFSIGVSIFSIKEAVKGEI